MRLLVIYRSARPPGHRGLLLLLHRGPHRVRLPHAIRRSTSPPSTAKPTRACTGNGPGRSSRCSGSTIGCKFSTCPETELLTHDPKGKTIDKTLTVGAYVCWRIADKSGVDRFIRTVGDPRQARNILGQRISSRLGAEVGNLPVDDLIGVAPAAAVEARMDRLRDRVLTGGDSAEDLRALARDAYGIEIVDIRLRRFNHPPGVRGEIFARIKSEREKKATEYRTEGMKLASDIRSLAEREAKDIDTEARSRSERLRKEAEIKADEIRNQTQSQDRDFYVFLQKLQAYQKILGETRDVLLLSSKHRAVRFTLEASESRTRNEEWGHAQSRIAWREEAMKYVLAILGLLLLGYLATGLTQVRPGERAVVRRFGQVVAKPGPGLWVGVPWGIDRVDRVAVDQVRRVTVGYRPDTDDSGLTPPGQLLTGDHNLVNLQVVVDYAVRPDQVEDYLVQADRASGLVERAAEAALAEWVAGRGVDDVLITGKSALPAWLVRQTQERIEPYRLGVQVQAAAVASLLPPEEVRAAFESVTRAQTAIRTEEHKARQTADQVRRDAEARRYATEQTTAAYANEKVSLAKTEAEAFAKRREQYHRLREKNPAMLAAIWWDEMAKVFERLNQAGRIDLLDNHLVRRRSGHNPGRAAAAEEMKCKINHRGTEDTEKKREEWNRNRERQGALFDRSLTVAAHRVLFSFSLCVLCASVVKFLV